MEVVKPKWIAHAPVGAGGRKSGQASSIFSISIDSTGTRLATGGLDTTVRIWHLAAIDGGLKGGSRLAAVMSRHTGAVLCVRWSPSNLPQSLLATGSDDSIILIWQRNENGYANAAFEGGSHSGDPSEAPTESYTVLHRLAGHESDVNGLAWSLDGFHLASCSLDGQILLWDVRDGFSLVKRLKTDDRCPVKGLVWDPLGKHLAAQTNTGAVYIWRVFDWKLDATITGPFSQPLESYTYFSRPSWSPDGRIICIPDSLNESDSVAVLVERENQWPIEQSLVGHASSVQVAAFCPRIFLTPDSTKFLLVALGSQDGVVSLWSSCASKPIAVLTGLFEHAVMDLAWADEGDLLYTASYDGSVARIKIDHGVVGGTPMSHVEQSGMMNKIEKQSNNEANTLPSSVAQIQLKTRLDALMDNRVGGMGEGMMAEAPLSSETNLPTVSNSQPSNSGKSISTANVMETRLKNGKRRITPQLLQSAIPLNSKRGVESHRVESQTVLIGKPARKSWIKASPLKAPLVLNLKGRPLVLEIVNITGKGCRISCLNETKHVLWEEQFEVQATCAAATENGRVVVGFNDNRIHLYSHAGRKIMPPMVFSATPVQLLCFPLCIALLDNGQFFVWDCENFTLVISDELPAVGLGSELVGLDLRMVESRDDVVLAFCFVERRLIYSKARRCFFEVGNDGMKAADALLHCIWGPDSEIFDAGLIPKILACNTRELRDQTVAHLEAQIAACELMGDTVEMVPWLCAYAQRLAFDENVAKAEDLIHLLHSQRLESFTGLCKTLAAYMAQSPSLMVRRIADDLLK